MIYTSYFAKLKSMPDNIIPISICGKAPSGYKGQQYKKLAPKFDFFMQWKQNHDNEFYTQCYNEQVLNALDATQVVKELDELLLHETISIDDTRDQYNRTHIALVCYEKPEDFCHRHLVANWLNKNGYLCKEYNL